VNREIGEAKKKLFCADKMVKMIKEMPTE